MNKSAVLVFFVLFASYALVTSCSRQTSDPAMPPVLELTAVPSPPEPVQIGDLFDFSRCGYKQGVEPIPFVLAVITVRPGDGDDTDLIQQAIDTVSARAPDANGFRGAVLLAEGEFQVNRHLKISANGVVLRGSGNEETRILADGIDRRTLIRVEGAKPEEGSSNTVASAALRAGDTQIELNNAMGLSVGDTVFLLVTQGQANMRGPHRVENGPSSSLLVPAEGLKVQGESQVLLKTWSADHQQKKKRRIIASWTPVSACHFEAIKGNENETH